MNCPHCGIPLVGGITRCPKCKYDTKAPDGGPEFQKKLLEERENEEKKQKEQEQAAEKYRQALAKKSSFLSTTGYGFDGYHITQYLGIKSGEVVLGTGVFSEFSAGVSDFFGVASNTMSTKLTTAKNAALSKLIDACMHVGANAVIGVDIDIMTVGTNMIVACANGTAVYIERVGE